MPSPRRRTMVERGASVVLVTAPDAAVAEELVQALVQERLAACGNIVPGVQSIYRWEGTIQREVEVLIVLKTTAGQVPALIERVSALHPYEVPEVLEVPVQRGLDRYLGWIHESIEEVTTE